MRLYTVIFLVSIITSFASGEQLVGVNGIPPLWLDDCIVVPISVYRDIVREDFFPVDVVENMYNELALTHRYHISVPEQSSCWVRAVEYAEKLGLGRCLSKGGILVDERDCLYSFQLSNHHITLVKCSGVYCAIAVREVTESSLMYSWWTQLDGTGDFSKKNVLCGEGIVSRDRIKNVTVSNRMVNWRHGPVEVYAGGFVFDWEYPLTLKLEPSRLKEIRCAVAKTQMSSVNDVDVFSKELVWRYGGVSDGRSTVNIYEKGLLLGR